MKTALAPPGIPFVLVALVLVLHGPSRAEAEVREWTRASDGRKIQAEFVGMKDENTVQIKMTSGQIFEVPLASLSEADNAYVKELAAEKMKENAPASGSGTPATVPEGEVTVTLSGVHICCGDCVDAVMAVKEDSEAKVDPAVELSASRSDGTVTIKAPTGQAAQVAVRAISAAGFYGTSDHDAIKIPDLKESDFTTPTMVIRDVHLCCRGCVRDFEKAIESVDGVEEATVKAGSTRVTLKGEDFKTYDVMKALRDAGFGGKFQ